jgi:2-acylglycerol O-acyltransferase 2
METNNTLDDVNKHNNDKKINDNENEEDEFIKTASYIRNHQNIIKNPMDKLTLYSLYKQSTVGKCNEPQPSSFHIVDRAKHDAWSALGTISQDEAKTQYIQFVHSLENSSTTNKGNSKINKDEITNNNHHDELLLHPEEQPNNNENNTQDNESHDDQEETNTNMDWDTNSEQSRENFNDDNENDNLNLDDEELFHHQQQSNILPSSFQDMEDIHILQTLFLHLPHVIYTNVFDLIRMACILPLQMLFTFIGTTSVGESNSPILLLLQSLLLPSKKHSTNTQDVRKHTNKKLEDERQKQNAVVMLMISIMPLTVIVYLWTFVLLIFPLTTLPTVSYLIWALYMDDSPHNGKRKPFLQEISLGKYFVDYFPITLIRASPPLDPSRKYVFVYSPHGIAGLGAFGAFATEAAGFHEQFPGINLRLLTLEQNFKIPLIRELLLSCGMCSCSRKSCDQLLQRGPGSAICLVVGGAAEALEAEAGTYRLVLKRKGFIRVAIDNQADLIPIIAFGETDAFFTIPSNVNPSNRLLYQTYKSFQHIIKKYIGFVIPIFWGRFGFMPRRIPIRVITGEPIIVETFQKQLGLQGEELVDAVHSAYVAAIRRLFDENKLDVGKGIQIKEELKFV